MALIILVAVLLWIKRKSDNPKSTVLDDSCDNWYQS